MYIKDLKCYDDMYYVGDVVDIDGSGWVDLETAEKILLEFNNGVV